MCNYNLFKKTTHFIAMQLYLFMVTRVGFMWLRIYRFRVSRCSILGRLEVVWFLKDDIFIHHIISCAMHIFLFHKYVICSTWCYIRFETHTHAGICVTCGMKTHWTFIDHALIRISIILCELESCEVSRRFSKWNSLCHQFCCF